MNANKTIKETEKQIETYLREEAKRKGAIAMKVQTDYLAGMPDRLLILPSGGVVWVEVKAPKGRLREIQRVTHQKLRSLQQKVHIVRSVEECKTLLEKYIPNVKH